MRPNHRQRGAVFVEFALVLPVLLLLVLGMMQFGLALNYWIDETHLTRDAARYAAVGHNPGGEDLSLQEYMLERAATAALRDGSGDYVDGPAEFCIDYPTNEAGDPPTSGEVGDPVQATMSVSFNFIPFLGDRVGFTELTISSSATMRLETAADAIEAGCA